jgi:dihydroorotate dehydrogenase
MLLAGLRALQSRSALDHLITRVQDAMRHVDFPDRRPPLLVKIAPDLTEADMDDIAAVVLARGVDGLVISNTTIGRPPEIAGHPYKDEAGGLSGQPLFRLSTDVLREMYARTKGKVPIVGCGGVASGRQAYEKIRAGACLVELYTGLVRCHRMLHSAC